MPKKRTPGLRKRNGRWHVEKQVLGVSICESTGTSDLREAELILAKRIEEVRLAIKFGDRPDRTASQAFTKYLKECTDLKSWDNINTGLKDLERFIGDVPLSKVHIGLLEPYIQERKLAGVKTKTINLVLGMLRRVLRLAAGLWRDENGLSWLETPPLIQLLKVTDARKPYPLLGEEQNKLFQVLPDHLRRMCLYKVNTGCREAEVCNLKWEWERLIPEIDSSIFIIPGSFVKNGEDRVVVLNDIAKSVINELRGSHPDYVFTYKGFPIKKINNSGWKTARKKVNLTHVRVHDLKHTYGQRLREKGVSLETRKVLLGHKNGDITTHYSTPELKELLDASNKVCDITSSQQPLLALRNSTK